jgi:hypothetical protein
MVGMRRFLSSILFLAPVVARCAGDPPFKLGDIELPGDCSALKPGAALSPEDEARNGYRHVEKIGRHFVYPEIKKSGFDPDRFYDLHLMLKDGAPSAIMIGKAKLLLKRHAATMAEWDKLLATEFYREPGLPVTVEGLWGDSWIPSFRALREATYANLWRIRVALYEGRQRDAFADWLRFRSGLARLAAHSDLLVSQMIVTVLEGICSRAAWELSPTAADAKEMAVCDENFDAAHWRRVMLRESHFLVLGVPRTDKEIVAAIEADFTRGKLPKTVEEYRARILPLYGTPVERARESLAEIRRLGAPGFEIPRVFRYLHASESPYSKRWRALEAAGYDMGVTPAGLAYLGEWNFRIRRRFDRVIVALRAYAGEHNGVYPKSLDELVPGYLASVPLDPFSEKPLRFDPRWPAVWSVGPDGKDDDGAGILTVVRFDAKEPADIVSRPFGSPDVRPVPPPPPKPVKKESTAKVIPAAP